MTLQEAFNTADNLVRMQQLEIEQLKERADNQEDEIKRLTAELKFLNGEYDFMASRVDPMLERITNQYDEIARLKRDLVDAVQNIQAHSMIVDNAEKDAEIERLKRYELEYKKREWDEAILYNNLFKASMLVAELANALKSAHDTALIPGNKEAYELIRKANEITYHPKDQNALGNLEH